MSAPIVIGVAGPSGAGKSVFCRRIQDQFFNVTRLKLDDFFKDLDDVPKKGPWVDWDRPDAICWEPLIEAARRLKNREHAMVPHYSRRENRRIGEKCALPADIILLDGFMALHHPELRKHIHFSLFFDLSEESQVSRRRERQPWVEDGYLHEVMLPAARSYIMPSKTHATFIINAERSIPDVAAAGLNAIQVGLNVHAPNLQLQERKNPCFVA